MISNQGTAVGVPLSRYFTNSYIGEYIYTSRFDSCCDYYFYHTLERTPRVHVQASFMYMYALKVVLLTGGLGRRRARVW